LTGALTLEYKPLIADVPARTFEALYSEDVVM
jgi:hypothetical protein